MALEESDDELIDVVGSEEDCGKYLKSITNNRGLKDVAPFHLLLVFENPDGSKM